MDASRSGSRWMALGALFAGLAVIVGAFGAHWVHSYFAEKYAGEVKIVAGEEIPAARMYLNDYQTGVRYQMWHALGMIAVGLAMQRERKTSLIVAAWSFLLGILCFSGALYVLTLTGQTWLGAIAPIGGTAYIVGWFAFAYGTYPADMMTLAS